MAQAGVKILEAGIESGSEAVRFHIGKKFSNQDIDVFLERVHKYNIKVVLLMLVGYPTETEKDFQDTMDLLTKNSHYRDSGTIVEACLGGTLRVEPNSKLAEDPMIHFIPMENNKQDDLLWVYKNNPDLTLKERIRRRLILLDHAEKLKYLSPTNAQEILYLQAKWQELKNYDKQPA
jgi:radical SAM superfamily enzyme YgiQ (UPF0313 family)